MGVMDCILFKVPSCMESVMSSDNNKQLESVETGVTDLEDNQNYNYIDMTKALVFSLVVVAIGLVIVLAEIWLSSSTQ